MTAKETENAFSNEARLENSSISIEVSWEEKATLLPDEFDDVPDGGLRAWLVAASGFCIFFTCLGFTSSFGVFQVYYAAHQLQGESHHQIAWIGSISAFIQFAAGAIGGPMFDRFGAKIMKPAALAYVFAIMMTSLCLEYWQFMLAQGVLMGSLMAFLQFSAFAAVGQYFNKKRAAAMGIVVSGSSIGGIVTPIALSRMLNDTTLGFGWSVRIIGFISIPLMIFSCLVIKARLPPRTRTFFIPSAFKEAKFVLLVAALFFMFMGMFTPSFFLPTYAVSRGIDPTLASYLIAILNAASTFGRIIPGLLADRYGRLNIFAFAGLLTGFITLCMTRVKTTAELVVYAIALGFSSSTIISGASTALTLCSKDPRDIGTYLGMGIAVSSVSALVGPPINGAFIDTYGGFLQVSIFSGVMLLVGGCFVIACKAVTAEGLLGKV